LVRTIQNNTEQFQELFSYLNSHGFEIIPSVTNFITIKTGSEEASLYLYNQLLNHGVIIRPLRANLMPDHVRISIGTKDEMLHFYEAMNQVLPDYLEKYGALR
jgi:histidinol-phosphate aminotransferase